VASPPSQSGHQSPHSGFPSCPGQSLDVTAVAAADAAPLSPPPPSHDLHTIEEDDIATGSQEKNKNKRENEKHGKQKQIFGWWFLTFFVTKKVAKEKGDSTFCESHRSSVN
jgi:hypothetical protein